MEKLYRVYFWNVEEDREQIKDVTFEDLVAHPGQVHVASLAYVLLTHLREERGLPHLPEAEYYRDRA